MDIFPDLSALLQGRLKLLLAKKPNAVDGADPAGFKVDNPSPSVIASPADKNDAREPVTAKSKKKKKKKKHVEEEQESSPAEESVPPEGSPKAPKKKKKGKIGAVLNLEGALSLLEQDMMKKLVMSVFRGDHNDTVKFWFLRLDKNLETCLEMRRV
ncbi:hypothetical protein Bca52824_035864 [Brassica carinata]|uniref:Uncharacterized protein n=1 Tax=Brassica carinata TaxID=52824 RepID=A0A8X7S3X5_BRACI|nr:hypothetical protein Bca52824_035864 [Brassica carinata]